MKQVITRMTPALHEMAKDEAARRGQSLNDFITEAITAQLGDDEHPPFRARAAALGLLATPAGGWKRDDLTPEQREQRRRAWWAQQPPGAAQAVWEAFMADRRGEPWP